MEENRWHAMKGEEMDVKMVQQLMPLIPPIRMRLDMTDQLVWFNYCIDPSTDIEWRTPMFPVSFHPDFWCFTLLITMALLLDFVQ